MSDETYHANDYEEVLLTLHESPKSMDELIELLGWTHKKTNGVLTQLNLRRRIETETIRQRGKKITKYRIKGRL